MPKLKNFIQKSRLESMRVNASHLIETTVEELKKKYYEDGISDRTIHAIAPLVENGEDPNMILAREDFDFFCQHISPVFKKTLHHEVWTRALITEQSNQYLHRIAGRNVSILAPRGGAKSTKLGLFFAWAIGINALEGKALQILYISANRELALAKSETIRNIIDSEQYRKVFPDVLPHPKKWASPLWSIDRAAAGIETTGQEEFTMIAAGILGTIASKRTNIIGYDDLVKNAEDIASPAVRRKIPRTHYSVVMPTLFPGGRVIAINTRYRPDDIHVTDFIPSKGFNVLEQSAIIPRRELINLGVFRQGVEKVTAINTEALDESEAIAIARQEEEALAKQRAAETIDALTPTGEDDYGCVSPTGLENNGGLEGDTGLENNGGLEDEVDSGSQEGFSTGAMMLSKQLMVLQDYGIEVRPIESFTTEEEWESYLDEEVSYWEEMWSLDFLRSRRDADPTSFMYQYQNKVERVDGQGIPLDHIHYGKPPMGFDYFCIGGDLATSKQTKADYTVFLLVGKAGNQYWALDYWRGKVTGNLRKIEHILDLYENWEDSDVVGYITPWRVAIEKVQYQASMSADLVRELYQKRTLTNIVVSPIQLKGGKEAHMESITGAFANGLVWFNEGIDWSPFVEELQGLGSHDDCVDAIAIALQSLGVRSRIQTADDFEALQALQQTNTYQDPYHGFWI